MKKDKKESKVKEELLSIKKNLEEKQKEFSLMQKAFCTLTSKLNVIQEIQSLMGSLFDKDKLLHKVLEIVLRALEVESASIILKDEEKQELYFVAAVGPKSEEIKKYRLKYGQGIAGWVLEQGEPVTVSDVSKDPRFSKEITQVIGYEVHCILCVPVISKGTVQGVIEVLNKKGTHIFVNDDIELLSSIANLVGIIIENFRFFERLSKGPKKIKKKVKKIKEKLKS
jgi:signal transduction protein with GAF and PtsI domain